MRRSEAASVAVAGRMRPKVAPEAVAGSASAAAPVGAYVIEGGQVRWKPAVDVTRIVLHVTFAALGVTFLLRRQRR